ncbi:MAG: cell division protein FtsA [Candidatus Doudnabacteria bacterium]
MAKEQYIVGLDIGTHLIRVVQGKLQESGKINIIGASIVPAVGLRRGVIVDIDEAVSSISAALEKVERMTGVPVERVNVSVGGNHIDCMDSRGVIAVSRADGEISDSDIVRVVDASEAVSIPPNREVVHVIPKTFTLDGQTGIKDPLGMTGIRLEVDTIIIHGATPFLKNLQKAILQTGVDIDQIVVSPLAAGSAVLTKRQKELGVALLDLGAGTTSLAVYEENNLIHTAVIPVGAMHITNDIAIGLRCTIETAEKVKTMYGQASPQMMDKLAEIDLNKLDPEESEYIPQTMVGEIIEARLEEIFDLAIKELKKIDKDGQLPAGIVLTGGGAQLPGVIELAKHKFRLPVSIGVPEEVDTVIDQVTSPDFATVIGLVLWGERYSGGYSTDGMFSAVSNLSNHKFVLKLKQWLKSFMP